MSTDKGALLASSTKASSEDPDSSNESKKVTGNLAISARHLPPVYVDIQEEIESNLDEINKQSKYQTLNFNTIKNSIITNVYIFFLQ